MTPLKIKSERKFNRVELNANLSLWDELSNKWQCQCLSFSEDSIDIATISASNSFTTAPLKIGALLKLQVSDIVDAPVIDVVIIKSAPNQLGLKFLN